VTPLISVVRTSDRRRPRKRPAGFTLLELMIVIAIIAGCVSIVIPRIGNNNNKIKAVLRELTVVSRQLHSKAKLSGATYRLVIDMRDDPTGKSEQAFWVEMSASNTLIKSTDNKTKPELDKDGKEIKKDDYALDASVTKKPRVLPQGLHFEMVELSRLQEPIKSGKAYIHYLPQGLVEEAAIHLKTDKDQHYTISIQPLTGKAEVISSDQKLQEIRKQ
jgi:general secretion pathway protein H